MQTIQGNRYFSDKSQTEIQYPYLNKDIETDIAIIGGGISGSAMAYFLSLAKIKNVVLEKDRVSLNNTSGATAMLQYELDDILGTVAKQISKSDIKKVYTLSLDAMKELDSIANKTANAFELSTVDSLLFSTSIFDENSVIEEAVFRQDLGAKILKSDQTVFPIAMKSGIIDRQNARTLDPILLARTLLNNASKQFTTIYENTLVTKIDSNKSGVVITTKFGNTIKANKVVVCTGFDTTLLNKEYGSKTVTYSIVTGKTSIPKWLEKLIIKTTDSPYFYMREVDGRIIAGGFDTNNEKDVLNPAKAKKNYQKLLEEIKKIYSPKKELKAEYKFVGVFATTKDNLGFIGEDKKMPNVFVSLGYGANGILFDIYAGKTLANLFANNIKDPNLKLFDPNRFD